MTSMSSLVQSKRAKYALGEIALGVMILEGVCRVVGTCESAERVLSIDRAPATTSGRIGLDALHQGYQLSSPK